VSAVRVCDVGPRDGLQNHAARLSPETRADLCRRLAGAGLQAVEAVSFVRADRVPQMAEPERVLAGVRGEERATFSALVLNERGYELAVAAGVTEIHVAVMATEAFAARNTNSTVDDALAAALRIIDRAHADGCRMATTISVAFACPFEGEVDPGFVASLAERLIAGGSDELMLADTIGQALPAQVGELTARVAGNGVPGGIHLHDTNGMGRANALAALAGGATIFESSIGGLGGCPFAPGAAGNVATEALVETLGDAGVETGLEPAALAEVSAWLFAELDRARAGDP
jgi:hydroxymethylglutaryl-CoA lyase/(R)-citramalyl-CoA lyase